MDPLWLLAIGMLVVIGAIVGLRLHAFFALILAALIVGGLTPRAARENYAKEREMSEVATQKFLDQSLGSRVAGAFGNTCGNIGILIALASVIGKCLLESGGADRIVRSTLRLLGAARAGLAFMGSGFVLAIPVFFDTVFYLLIPLAKALRLRTGRNYTLYVLGISAGGVMAHSLVPPTPGPLLVADRLGVPIGHMMLGGLIVGLITSCAGYIYGIWINSRLDVPLRDSADSALTELKSITSREDCDLPPLWISLLPILLPVVLIGADAILKVTSTGGDGTSALLRVTGFLGDKNIALAIAAAVALGLVVWKRQSNEKPLSASLQDALASGGLIILITAAGGAFGAMLQQTSVGDRIGSLAATYQLGILPLAWLVTALVRTAQGSATVAMITSVGIVASLVQPGTLAYNPVYVALVIGCGSKLFPWMNDSGFWIVNRMTGMTVGETVKTFSFQLCIMGIVGLVAVMLLAKLFPMV